MWLEEVAAVSRRRKGHNCISWFEHNCERNCTYCSAHTIVPVFVDITSTFLLPSSKWDILYNYWLLVPLLAGHGGRPPGYGNNDINLLSLLA
jgi:hypothetical protein